MHLFRARHARNKIVPQLRHRRALLLIVLQACARRSRHPLGPLLGVSRGAQLVPRHFAVYDRFLHSKLIHALKHLLTQQHLENHDSERPHVARAKVLLALEHLRRNVPVRALSGVQARTRVLRDRKPKVSNLWCPVLHQQHILRLDVAVRRFQGVDVLEARDDANKDVEQRARFERACLKAAIHVFFERAPRRILKHDKHPAVYVVLFDPRQRVEAAAHLDHVGVRHLPHHRDLVFELLHARGVTRRHFLDRHFQRVVRALVHSPESALAQLHRLGSVPDAALISVHQQLVHVPRLRLDARHRQPARVGLVCERPFDVHVHVVHAQHRALHVRVALQALLQNAAVGFRIHEVAAHHLLDRRKPRHLLFVHHFLRLHLLSKHVHLLLVKLLVHIALLFLHPRRPQNDNALQLHLELLQPGPARLELALVVLGHERKFRFLLRTGRRRKLHHQVQCRLHGGPDVLQAFLQRLIVQVVFACLDSVSIVPDVLAHLVVKILGELAELHARQLVCKDGLDMRLDGLCYSIYRRGIRHNYRHFFERRFRRL
mmetsp:Transcript_14865/g.39798  ORF Transcript_14865/g.39798 Transcript_14865/m.39798 type:complete len:545 (+) Transcript_14865:2770-4404(+)